METQELISLEIFCRQHAVPESFMVSLQDFGLIEIVQVENASHLHSEELHVAEKLLRLHEDLDINIEGIDAVVHLLQQIKTMQEEIRLLKNRLLIYENSYIERR